MSRYAVILAGGPGTRLWPMSRERHPKQLLPFGRGGRSLLRECLERLHGLFPPERVHIVAGADQRDAIREEAPEVPAENLVGEPIPRDTANAVGLGCALLAERDPQAVVGVFTADHVIEPIDRFQAAVNLAFRQIEERPEFLGTFGVKPTRPHPGLGYIHRGAALAGPEGGVFRVAAFKEKPNLDTAREYLESGEYYWNSGMFVWQAETMLGLLDRLLPENAAALRHLARSAGQPDFAERAASTYARLRKISIDYAVMEKAPRVLVVELDCQWADVGSWGELANVTGLDEAGNAVLARTVRVVDSRGNVLVTSDPGHLLAVIGLEEIIVVQTPDATLVCAKKDAQKIKALVAELNQGEGARYT